MTYSVLITFIYNAGEFGESREQIEITGANKSAAMKKANKHFICYDNIKNIELENSLSSWINVS